MYFAATLPTALAHSLGHSVIVVNDEVGGLQEQNS